MSCGDDQPRDCGAGAACDPRAVRGPLKSRWCVRRRWTCMATATVGALRQCLIFQFMRLLRDRTSTSLWPIKKRWYLEATNRFM